MCGVTGFLEPEGFATSKARTIAREMADAISHRGPDDVGVWLDSVVALGHRRLAVVDLSSTGHQPMLSASERYAISFNGEIYNHVEIRRRIEQELGWSAWKGTSDTESLLAAIEHFGVPRALNLATGMFAFALWDRGERVLYLARDRLGEKPMYYGWQGHTLLFGSELKALAVHPSFQALVDRGALSLFLRHNYIPAPWSIYRSIHKVPPGTYVRIAVNRGRASVGRMPDAEPYWSLGDVVTRGIQKPFRGSPSDAVDALNERLVHAIQLQTVADVPVGAFLSSGIDSSAIVALMQQQLSRPVKTFTIGFHEKDRDESVPAKAIADYLGTDHRELHVSPQDAMQVIPRIPTLYDEPFSDSSQIPTIVVSNLARQDVTVALSGDGGDELFGGYERYARTKALWKLRSKIPTPLRPAVRRTLRLVNSRWDQPCEMMGRLRRIDKLLGCGSVEELYYQRLSHWPCPETVVREGKELPSLLSDPAQWPAGEKLESRLMAVDALTYLPDDVLVKVDRAAMGASLETRAPFLDHRVVEFACELPLSLKIRQKEAKWILRRVLHRYVPESLLDRPKRGFSVPIGEWLRGALRDWGESLLGERRLTEEGFFHTEPIRRNWEEHVTGRREYAGRLWSVLMFQAWLDQVRTRRAP